MSVVLHVALLLSLAVAFRSRPMVVRAKTGYLPVALIAPHLDRPRPAPLAAAAEPQPAPRRGRPAHHRRAPVALVPMAPAPKVPTFVVEPALDDDLESPVDDASEPAGIDEGAGAVVAASSQAPVEPEAVPEAPPISPLEAAYLRIYQTLPGLPRALWVHGRVYTVGVQLCISADGRVDHVTLLESATPQLDALVIAALRTWRYRARMVAGRPMAFCHPMKIHYDVD